MLRQFSPYSLPLSNYAGRIRTRGLFATSRQCVPPLTLELSVTRILLDTQLIENEGPIAVRKNITLVKREAPKISDQIDLKLTFCGKI